MDKEYGTVPVESTPMKTPGMHIKSTPAVGNSTVKMGAKAGSGNKGDIGMAASYLKSTTCGSKGIGNGSY